MKHFKVEDSAFYGCSSLEHVAIPETVQEIGTAAFSGTLWLKEQQQKNPLVMVNTILVDGEMAEGDILIPEGVTMISGRAFAGCNNLTSVTMPDSVKRIGMEAFSECSNLVCVARTEKETTEKETAADGQSYPEGMALPEEKRTIGGRAFYKCSRLKSVTLPEGITAIHYSAFYKCKKLTSIRIPEGVTELEADVFSGCSRLNDIVIPESVTTIGQNAFKGTAWLKTQQEENPLVVVNHILIDGTMVKGEVVIPDGVTRIGNGIFSGCTSLASVTIPDSVTIID